jgi:hypothetical protein
MKRRRTLNIVNNDSWGFWGRMWRGTHVSMADPETWEMGAWKIVSWWPRRTKVKVKLISQVGSRDL